MVGCVLAYLSRGRYLPAYTAHRIRIIKGGRENFYDDLLGPRVLAHRAIY